jgi:amino acid transporter
MVLISAFSFLWIYSGKPAQIHFSLKEFFPNLTSMENAAFLTNVLFGLMGMEMSAVHAGDVQDPRRNYPRALLYSAVIILTTLVFACLSIAIVIPASQLNLVSGVMDAFKIFFSGWHLEWLVPLIAILIIIGSLSGATAWILGPARGLLVATEDSRLPRYLAVRNKHDIPIGILLIQGIIVTLISIVFLVMPTVNSSYWVLSNLTAQLALLFYILLFAAAIRLRYRHPQVDRAYRVPGGNWGIWLVCGAGIVTCMGAIILGFVPPPRIITSGLMRYEVILIAGTVICCSLPFVLYAEK